MGRKATVVAGSSAPWRGNAVTRARTHMATHTPWPHTCALCGKPVQLTDTWVIGHIKARATHPELTWVESNWRIEHRTCSNKTGQASVIAKAKAEARREFAEPDNSVFPHSEGSTESPPLSFSLSDDHNQPVEVREELKWNREVLERTEWLRPLLDVPEDASVPLMMTPVPADAVGTYGWDAVAWIERAQTDNSGRPIKLRWWQKLSLVRQLEHRADGSLCFETKVESAPRRAGKSVGLRGHALWRMEHGQELFGEVQTINHTAADMKICREIQRGAWRWAEANWGSRSVTRGNGKEQIENLETGDRWLTFAQDAVYGFDATVAMVDEAWNVKPDTVSEGLEPAMLERSSPQLVMTSTAHRRATSLMRTKLAEAQTMADPETLLLLWGAPIGSDPGDPKVWKDANPHWSEHRRKMIAKKYAKALAGEDDPEFDDPDPMRGFEAQYLNIWRINEPKTVGNPIVAPETWAAFAGSTPDRAPDSIAVEAWFAAGVSVARSWKPQDGPVIVSVTDHPDVPSAAAYVATLNPTAPVLVGSSLTDHAAWKDHGVRLTKMADSTRSQVGDMTRFIGERAFVHDGSPTLSEQVLAVRVSPGSDGPRIRSTGRADAIKAATWAINEAMNLVSSGITTVIYVEA